MNLKILLKKILLIPPTSQLSLINVLSNWNIKIGPYIYKKKYTTSDIIEILKSIGIGEGSNLLLHTAWDSFYNYTGKPKDIIDAILNLITEKGTLVMLSYPILQKGRVFDVRRTPTAAGFLSEVFRRYPGVKRSADIQQSVCAWGALADFLICEHQDSMIRFGEKSPFFKIAMDPSFTTLSIGLPHYLVGATIHVLEATQYANDKYFAQFYDTNRFDEYHYIDINGEEKTYKNYKELKHPHASYLHLKMIVDFKFDKNKYKKKKISNLNVTAYNCNYMFCRLCELSKKGIYPYTYLVDMK